MKKMLIAVLSLCCFACTPAIPHDVTQSSYSIIQRPGHGMATVVFVRTSQYLPAIPFMIHDGQKAIGVVEGGNCAVYPTVPGKHIFDAFVMKGAMMDGRNRYVFIDANLAPDRIYYILVTPYSVPSAGVFADFEPIRNGNEYWPKLPAWLSTCSVTDVNDETFSWDEGMARKNLRARIVDDERWRGKESDRIKKAIQPEDGVRSPVLPRSDRAKPKLPSAGQVFVAERVH